MRSMFLVTLLLPFGAIDDAGVTHRDVELGPLSLRENLAATQDAKTLPRPASMSEEEWAGICMLARRIRRVGCLPASAFTPDWILDLLQEDAMVLLDGAREVVSRQASFRGNTQALASGGGAGGEADRVVES